MVGGILGVGATYALAIPSMVLAPESLSYVVGLVVVSACGILAGYLAARIAKHAERLNGALSAWLSMLLQTYNWATGETTETALAAVSDIPVDSRAGWARRLPVGPNEEESTRHAAHLPSH